MVGTPLHRHPPEVAGKVMHQFLCPKSIPTSTMLLLILTIVGSMVTISSLPVVPSISISIFAITIIPCPCGRLLPALSRIPHRGGLRTGKPSCGRPRCLTGMRDEVQRGVALLPQLPVLSMHIARHTVFKLVNNE